MRNFIFVVITGSLLTLSACTKGGDEKVLLFECEQQFQGAACNTLGMKREGEEALKYFRMGCEKQNTLSCINLAQRTSDKAESLRVLKQACEWKNPEACTKAEEMEKAAAPK